MAKTIKQFRFAGPRRISGIERFLFLWVFACATGIFAQDEGGEDPSTQDAALEKLLKKIPRLQLAVVEGEMKVDGVLDEAVWVWAKEIKIERETYPALLEPAPVETRVKMVLHKEALWVAFWADDPNPEKIQAPLRDRDAIDLDDYVGIAIDPDGRRVTRYEFYVSASGVQADRVHNQVNDRRQKDWDADWESAAARTEKGYVVEMRIPLREMDLTEDPERRLISLKRQYPRRVRHYLGAVVILVPKEWSEVAMKERLRLIPSISLNPLWERPEDPKGDWLLKDQLSIGLDVEARFSPSSGGALTINPNFLEVEADLTSTSINDPFTTLVPEKRPFFVRGSEVYSTPFDKIYTRNIEDPSVGLMLGGTENDWTSSIFVVHDRELSVVVPGNLGSERVDLESDSVSGAFRVRRDFKAGLSMGVLGTLREGQDSYHNYALGVDVYYNVLRHHSFRGQWLLSDTQYSQAFAEDLYDPPEGVSPENDTGIPGETGFNEALLRSPADVTLQDDALELSYKYRPRFGHVTLLYRDVGDKFRGDLGYMTRTDYRQGLMDVGVNHYFREGTRKELSRVRINTLVYEMQDQAGDPFNRTGEIWLNYWGRGQSWIRLGYRHRDRIGKRFNQKSLAIDGNSKTETEQQLIFCIESSAAKNFRLIIAGRVGSAIDTDNYRLGDLFELEPEFRWNLGDRYEISVQNTYRTLDVEGGELFEENYLRLSMTYQLQKSSFIRLTLIDDIINRDPELYLYSEEDARERESKAELLFAWKPTQRNTFFVGVEALATDESILEDLSTHWDEVTVFVKYTRPFTFD